MNEILEEKPNYYSVIPADVRYDSRLKANEKLLYSEITALSGKTGVCTATNNYFSKLYNVSVVAVSKWIKNLKDLGYIDTQIEYKKGTKEIEKRLIVLNAYPIKKMFNTYLTNVGKGIKQKFKENNTSINNKNCINNKLLIQQKIFKKPSLEEVKEYCDQRKNSVNPEEFINYYESNGWKVGRNSMKDWKAAVRTWESRDKKNNKSKKSSKKSTNL